MTNTDAATLSGARILVTRPAHQAQSLISAIEAAGGTTRIFPALAIGPKTLTEAERRLLQQLDAIDTAFFISPNAVHHAFEIMTSNNIHIPAGMRLACVGAGSEQALAQHGQTNVIRPEHTFTSEGLLSRPEFANMQNRHVIIFRGNGGRELLKQSLEKRGARVDYIECYQRMMPAEDPAPLNHMLARQELDAITVTSSDALRNLLQLVRTDLHLALKELPLFVVSPRMAEVATELGFDHIYTSKRATDDAIVDALLAWCQDR